MQSYEKKEVHLILHLPSNNFYFKIEFEKKSLKSSLILSKDIVRFLLNRFEFQLFLTN